MATYSYGPWGELLGQTGSFDQPFRYAGYYFDSETGIYYLKSRYYSPELGRFLTKDTFPGLNTDPQSLNLYAYCVGNPIVNADWGGFFHYKVYKKYWMFYFTNRDCNKVIAALVGGVGASAFGAILTGVFGLVPGTIVFAALGLALSLLAAKIQWENEGNGVWIRYWRVRPPAGRFALEMGPIGKEAASLEEEEPGGREWAESKYSWKSASMTNSWVYEDILFGNGPGQIEIYRGTQSKSTIALVEALLRD